MIMENETISQKALRLLSEVPKENFITGRFTDYEGKCCAIGHYKRLTSNSPNNFSNDNCTDSTDFGCDIRILSNRFIKDKYDKVSHKDISDVNNFPTTNGYTEIEIKDRVIHLLTDMVAEGL